MEKPTQSPSGGELAVQVPGQASSVSPRFMNHTEKPTVVHPAMEIASVCTPVAWRQPVWLDASVIE